MLGCERETLVAEINAFIKTEAIGNGDLSGLKAVTGEHRAQGRFTFAPWNNRRFV